MNTCRMTLNDMKANLKSAERSGQYYLAEMLREEIDKVSSHHGFTAKRGGKREYQEVF